MIWITNAKDKLKRYNNGTEFLLQIKNGTIHFCRLVGNIPEDDEVKAIRLSDTKYIKLNNDSDFVIL